MEPLIFITTEVANDTISFSLQNFIFFGSVMFIRWWVSEYGSICYQALFIPFLLILYYKIVWCFKFLLNLGEVLNFYEGQQVICVVIHDYICLYMFERYVLLNWCLEEFSL
ncbi:hypothetical protein Dsin_018213 [Dipteronia sinensis]|uniref:Uncharacterized protein n=1 Tax=Dipteronia sinensis TaxID=43782 RepID=A0AAE0A4X7_9ROSI|nr:hypothetical protein Dsin_018213 [Dipteronia sinensis]